MRTRILSWASLESKEATPVSRKPHGKLKSRAAAVVKRLALSSADVVIVSRAHAVTWTDVGRQAANRAFAALRSAELLAIVNPRRTSLIDVRLLPPSRRNCFTAEHCKEAFTPASTSTVRAWCKPPYSLSCTKKVSP